MAETMYINLDLRGGHISEKGELQDYRHFIDIDNLKFIFKYGGKEYAIGGSDSIKDVNVTFASNQFSVSDNLDVSKKYISLRFKAPAELILTDNPTLIINSNIYTIESGYFKSGDIVICNLDNEGRKAFFRNIDREEVIKLDNIMTFADDGKVKITWNSTANTNVIGYYITYSNTIPNNVNDGTTIRIDNPNVTSYTINGLENDKMYYFNVSAITKRNVFFSNNNYVSDKPFSGYLLKDIPLGSLIKSNDGTLEFYKCAVNHYNNGVTMLSKQTYEVPTPLYNGSSNYYFKNFNNANDVLSLFVNTLVEKGIEPIETSVEYHDVLGEIISSNQYAFPLAVNEYNGKFVSNDLTSNATPLEVFSENFTPTNNSNEFRNSIITNDIIVTRDKARQSSSSSSWYMIKDHVIKSVAISKTTTYYLQPAFNINQNIKAKKNEDGSYTLI